MLIGVNRLVLVRSFRRTAVKQGSLSYGSDLVADDAGLHFRLGSAQRVALDSSVNRTPAVSRRQGTHATVLRVENGKIAEEIGLDDGVTTHQHLNLIHAA